MANDSSEQGQLDLGLADLTLPNWYLTYHRRRYLTNFIGSVDTGQLALLYNSHASLLPIHI